VSSVTAPMVGWTTWFRRNNLRVKWKVVSAAGVLVLVAVMAIGAPLLAPQDPDRVNLDAAFQGIGAGHILGADELGRDILSRLIWGARTSLAGPLLVVVFSTLGGTLIAVSAAWLGGRFDAVVGLVTDIALGFPGLLLAVLAVALFGPGLLAPVIALVIAYTPWVARLTRSAALRERSQPYIAALTVQGFPGFLICLRHLIPNIAPLILAQTTINYGYAVVDLAAISFLGLGVQPPTADWGSMVATGEAGILQGQPEVSIAAGAMIVLTVVALNVLGEAIADRSAVSRR
jgi:peptide/nickel transport system permease protein